MPLLLFKGEVYSVDTEERKDGVNRRVYITFAGLNAPFDWPDGEPTPAPGTHVDVSVSVND